MIHFIHNIRLVAVILSLFGSTIGAAQHEHTSEQATGNWGRESVFKRAFTDTRFTGQEVDVVLLTVPAGATDTSAHVHDAELIGYILEGEVITKMKNKAPQKLKKGDSFYEYPNEVHESLQNPGKTDAKILLYFLYTEGAVLYRKLDGGK